MERARASIDMSALTINPHTRPEPLAIDAHSSSAGLRAVASFEALKGVLTLVLMVVVIAFHEHAEDIVDNLLFHLHLDPERKLSQTLMNAATRLSDMRVITIAAAAVSYASVRFVESWGLWHRRVWAEWFALLSGALYLPLELLKLTEHPNWIHWAIFLINIVIVLYMLWVRVYPHRNGPAQAL